jgi:hypothetical protein
MKPSRLARWGAPLALLTLSCYAGSARDVSPQRAAAIASDPSWTFAPNVPFVRQQSDSDCGPAALTMVLGHFGVRASVAELVAVSPPDRAGVRAGALRDIARSRGLSAFVVPATLDPGRGLRVNSLEGFAREWAPTGRVAIVVGGRSSR